MWCVLDNAMTYEPACRVHSGCQVIIIRWELCSLYLDYTVGFTVGELPWLERDVAAGVLGLSGLIHRLILTINEVYDVTMVV